MPHQRVRGLTLIELLIALAIFAVLATFAYRAIDQLVLTEQEVARVSGRWESASRSFARIDRDLAAALPRAAINPYGQREPALLYAARGNTLAVTRSGFAGARGESAAPQRVAYRHEDGEFKLWLWPSVDAAPRSAPAAATLMTGVRAASWRFLDSRDAWVDAWPPSNLTPPTSETTLPKAVELTLSFENGDVLTRRVVLWASAPPAS
jgi:general secretion pathway protein J